MAKKSIGSLMRKKLSDITNNPHSQQLDTLPSDNSSIQQLLKERTALIELLAERNKMIEASGAQVQRLRGDVKKLQLQNWNLAQSNSHMLAELNMGRERMKTLQHEILWRAALIKGKTMEKVDKIHCENNPTTCLEEGQPSPETSNDEKHNYCMNRRRIRSKSTGSSTASKNTTKDKVKDSNNRRRLRRHSTTLKTHEHEPLENLFELEDATYLATTKTERGGKSSVSNSRNEAPTPTPKCSFGRPLRRAVQKVHSYKEIPVNVKMRRLED